MESTAVAAVVAAEIVEEPVTPAPEQPTLSRKDRKKILRKQRARAHRAKKKALQRENKELRQKENERKQKELAEIAGLPEEERAMRIEAMKASSLERKDNKRSNKAERTKKKLRLTQAKEIGQNIVIDLEFSHLMTSSEIRTLGQQVLECYTVNGRSTIPCHLWLTGCNGKMETQLKRMGGRFDKWVVERESRSYIEVMQDRKHNLVYLTSDSDTVLDELDINKTYIICGMIDRIRRKGMTMKKAEEQGIQTAKLPIVEYLKTSSSSKVLTANQVMEILVKFLETKDWKTSYFHAIHETSSSEEEKEEEDEGALDKKRTISSEEEEDDLDEKRNISSEEEEEEDEGVLDRKKTISSEEEEEDDGVLDRKKTISSEEEEEEDDGVLDRKKTISSEDEEDEGVLDREKTISSKEEEDEVVLDRKRTISSSEEEKEGVLDRKRRRGTSSEKEEEEL